MEHYIEITIINSSEIAPYFIWSKLFTQVHLAFVEQKDANNKISYGISFPEYKVAASKGKTFTTLGFKLRIFANSIEELKRLNLEVWLERLTDYVHIKSIKPVDKVTSYLNVNRYQPKSTAERLARRYARRHNVSFDDALKRLGDYKPESAEYPFIKVKSLSSDNQFSLAIIQTAVDEGKAGKYSTYGLSAVSTVPHW